MGVLSEAVEAVRSIIKTSSSTLSTISSCWISSRVLKKFFFYSISLTKYLVNRIKLLFCLWSSLLADYIKADSTP